MSRVLGVLTSLALAAPLFVFATTTAGRADTGACGAGAFCAGAASVDMTWHTGAATTMKVLGPPGERTLSVSFDGTAEQLPSSTSVQFTATTGTESIPPNIALAPLLFALISRRRRMP